MNQYYISKKHICELLINHFEYKLKTVIFKCAEDLLATFNTIALYGKAQGLQQLRKIIAIVHFFFK